MVPTTFDPTGQLAVSPVVAAARAVYAQIIRRLPHPERWAPRLESDFLMLDLETTGFSRESNRIVLVGLMHFVGGKPLDSEGVDAFIRTPYDPTIWSAAYGGSRGESFWGAMRNAAPDHDAVEIMRAVDANDGSIYGLEDGVIPKRVLDMVDRHGRPMFKTAVDATGIRSSFLEDNGFDRREALAQVYDLLMDARNSGTLLVGHNLIKFDLPFLFTEFSNVLGSAMTWPEDQVLDTGMIVKAAHTKMFLETTETLYDFFQRVGDRRAYGKWALDGFCVPTFQLAEKHGVDCSKQHASAAYDCFVAASLLRELAGGEA